MRENNLYRDRYISLFNDEKVIHKALSGVPNPERQQLKLEQICRFVESNKQLFHELKVNEEFIVVRTSKYIINIAVTLTGAILFSTINIKTNYLAKPKSTPKLDVLFNAMENCLNEIIELSYEGIYNRKKVHEDDNTVIYFETVNETLFKLHTQAKTIGGNRNYLLIDKEQLLALKDFLNDEFENQEN